MKTLLAAASGLAAVLAMLALRPQDPLPTEASRLRAHFDSVDVELRAADARGLNPVQRESRNRLIGWLRDYRNAGAFPINDRFPDRRAPFFRDSRGVTCAMAYLIERSGRRDIVDRVAATRNNAYVAELSTDPALARWLDSVGLTVREAARIQPTYSPVSDKDVSTSYALTSIALTGASLAMSTLNLAAPSTGSGFFGLLAGASALTIGIVELAKSDGESPSLALANAVIGTVSVGLGIRGLIVGHRDENSRESKPPVVTLSPLVESREKRTAFGLVLGARF